MWYAIRHVLIAPLVSVSFMMNFAGDVMTSLIKPFSDLAYTVCYYGSGDWLLHLGDEGSCTNKTRPLQRYIIPIILLGPYWLRLMQCLRRYYDTGNRVPNLPNAFKYALSMCITVFGVTNPSISQPFGWSTLQVLWTVAYMVSTLYSWFWDVNFDWAAFTVTYSTLTSRTSVTSVLGGSTQNNGEIVTRGRRGSNARKASIDRAVGPVGNEGGSKVERIFTTVNSKCPNIELRGRRMITKKRYYYIAIVVDLFLRFFWAYTLIPYSANRNAFTVLGMYVAPFAAVAEILRRTMWSVLRLENEHVNNTAGYRKYKHIPLHYPLPDSKSKKPIGNKRQISMEVFVFTLSVVIITTIAILFRSS